MTTTLNPGHDRYGGRPRPDRPARPATVWPLPEDSPDGDGPAPWLLPAVEKVVAVWTRPGQSVLLLAPPEADSGPGPGTDRSDRRGTGPGLFDAAGSVARLGRGVRTATLGELPTGRRSGSGPRLAPLPAPGPGTGRADLVVTTAGPDTAGWAAAVPWADLLRPGGVLAFVTHSDSRGEVLVEPTHLLTAAARRNGLEFLDQLVLLAAKVRDSRLAPAGPGGAHVASPRRHALLLLFTKPREGDGGLGETG